MAGLSYIDEEKIEILPKETTDNLDQETEEDEFGYADLGKKLDKVFHL